MLGFTRSNVNRHQASQSIGGVEQPRSRRALRFFVTSWRRRLLVLAFTMAVLALLSSPLYSLYTGARDFAIESAGLGLVFIALFLATVLFVWVRNLPLLLKHWNTWIGFAVLTVASLAVLAYWETNQGVLHEVTMGGNLGHGLKGANPYLGVLRTFPLILAGLWVAFPKKIPLALFFMAHGLIVSLRYSWRFSAKAYVIARSATLTLYTYLSFAYIYVSKRFGRSAPAYEGVGVSDGGEEAPQESPYAEASYLSPSPGYDLHSPSTYVEESGQEAFSSVTYDTIPRAPSEDTPPSEPEQPSFPWGIQPTPTSELEEQDDIDEGEEEDNEDFEEETYESSQIPFGSFHASERSWKTPPLDMLSDAPENPVSEEDQRTTAQTIERTLGEYGIEVHVRQVKPGPTVTMYGLEPGWNRRYKDVREKDQNGQVKLDEDGRPIITRVENKTRVKVGSIVAREKDLALALAASSLRIEAPVPGEAVVGIEVPNANPSTVTLRSAMQSDVYTRLRSKAPLPIALGKGSGGEVVVTDLTRMPHLLIAGATGSGKSVCINAVISCLLMEKSPEDLRLLLIDPKRVELNPYNGIPHLLKPTVVEAEEAVSLLKGLINEMFRRYKEFEEIGARNIQAYNKKSSEKMPYIVVVIDELADLMMTSQYEAENSICRLAQLGRATGIHMVVATQRPSVNVVTGLIKANFPSRISFAVASQVDSRTILDSAGAEKLLGRGDLLFLPLDGLKPKRAQGVFISDQEVEGIVRHWATVEWPPVAEISLEVDEEDQDDNDDDFPRDELLDKAVELANSHTRLSTSLLQRKLRIGYPRAARLMEQLEDEGIVIPGEPGKPREVTTNWS